MFILAILAGSFLLFLVQPMVARMALPRLGGAPAVWNSAMVVYQALLLGGYGYAHWLGRFALRTQAGIHLAVLLAAGLWLPIGLGARQLPEGIEPALWAPWLLASAIGPLFFAVSAQAPLLGRWFGAANAGRNPYALYAASNLGSFAGLLAYPLLVEPLLSVARQSLAWSAGYLLLVALVAACAPMLPPGRSAQEATTSPPPPRRTVLAWIALAFVPSGLMLATSTFITTDIVAVPLLWVLPLGLYLLSFSVAFAGRRAPADLLTRIAPLSILMFGGIIIAGYQERPWLNAGIALTLLFMVSVALHTALYRSRPEPDRLTGFYLAMSLGGALGGVFAGLVAPVLFDWTWEYPLLVLAAGALVPQTFLIPEVQRIWLAGAGRRRLALGVLAAIMLALVVVGVSRQAPIDADPNQGLLFGVIALLSMAVVGRRAPFLLVLAGALALFGGWRSLTMTLEPGTRTRSYFGVYTIRDAPGRRQIAHGTTIHGIQLLGSAARERMPTTYYAPGSGVGQAMQALPALYGGRARVGVVGLGAGTLACYARPGQAWTIYEIDPAVVRIAEDPTKFTFLRRCLPHPHMIVGDARLRLAAAPPGGFDLLVLDAFSSDSVPMHLVTSEAFVAYRRVLAPDGLLLVHVSNRFIDLAPVVSSAAVAQGWSAAALSYRPRPDPGAAVSASAWIALSFDREKILALKRRDAAWQPLPRYPRFTPWSDDFASILPLLTPGR